MVMILRWGWRVKNVKYEICKNDTMRLCWLIFSTEIDRKKSTKAFKVVRKKLGSFIIQRKGREWNSKFVKVIE